jgi:hypothetical protein
MLDRSLALRFKSRRGLPRVRTARKQERQVSFIGARVANDSRSFFKSAIARFCAQQSGERHCPELLTARVNNWILFRNKYVTNLLDRSLALRFKSVAGWPYAGDSSAFTNDRSAGAGYHHARALFFLAAAAFTNALNFSGSSCLTVRC